MVEEGIYETVGATHPLGDWNNGGPQIDLCGWFPLTKEDGQFNFCENGMLLTRFESECCYRYGNDS